MISEERAARGGQDAGGLFAPYRTRSSRDEGADTAGQKLYSGKSIQVAKRENLQVSQLLSGQEPNYTFESLELAFAELGGI